MCGRFTLTINPADLQETFQDYTFPQKFAPRYNIAPTQPVLVIPNDERNAADFFLWGLIPMWAKDPGIGSRLINARAETLAEKPSFRGSLKYKRCLVLADGFKLFAFAGLWDSWNSPDGAQVKTCTIITTEPNDLMTLIHNRMPAILHRRDYARWLDPSPQTPETLLPLIRPYPAEQMNAYPVSTQVNKPENDHPELIVQVK
jgi:putative SOS response-associated peptidase YedK